MGVRISWLMLARKSLLAGRALRQLIGDFQLLVLGLHHRKQLVPGRFGELPLHLLQQQFIGPAGQAVDQGNGVVRV